MHVAGMLLGCLLLGAGPNEKIGRSAEIVVQAMQLPAGSPVVGQPMTLLAALGSTADRSQQLKVVRAYWRLVQSAAEYSFCRDYVKALARIKPGGPADASVKPATAAAAAQLREAELATVRAQYELAELIRLPAGSPLPLPNDRPVVVPYDTKFNEMFAGRTPPEGARLSDKILPLQRQAIEDRAAAVQAADDTLIAVSDNYQSGRGDAVAVVTCGRELLRQQRAFIETVCAYNRNIADYALLVVALATPPQDLVTILIGSPSGTSGATPSGDGQPARPTSATEPIPTNPTRQPARNVPTLAPPRPDTGPTSAPVPDGWKANDLGLRANPDPLKPVDKNEPPLKSPQGDAKPNPPAMIVKPVVPLDSLPPAVPRTANKPAVRPPAAMGGLGGAAPGPTPLYPALATVMPAARAKQLALAVYADGSLPQGSGKPISLADCLLRDGNGTHRATIEAFWLVRQRAAQYQLLAGQAKLLDALGQIVLDRRNESSGAADMLRVRAAQLATQAMMRDAHVALVEAQFALALRIGAVADAAWPLASTVPHSGGYDPKVNNQPQSLTQSWTVQRLLATIPGLGESVQQHAAAVVDADAARVAASDKYAAGGAAIEQVIGGVAEQTEQTSAFLDAMAAYNRAIAEYATTVLPPGTPAGKLAAALVTKP
jgi:hypothetical protein